MPAVSLMYPQVPTYARSVAWAVENGILTGTGNGRFSPDATCTRGAKPSSTVR